MKEKKLVLTGFEPFGGSNVNPSEIIVKKFNDKIFSNHNQKLKIVGKIIPLEYSEINVKIENIIKSENPDFLLMLGQAPRSAINIERVAINIASVENTKYNCGSTPFEEKIVDNGPDSYFSTANIIKIRDLLYKNNISAKISNTAGTFGCNQIFYSAMHILHNRELKNGKNSCGVFIHIPMIPVQVKEENKLPSMEIATIEKAIDIILKDYFLKLV